MNKHLPYIGQKIYFVSGENNHWREDKVNPQLFENIVRGVFVTEDNIIYLMLDPLKEYKVTWNDGVNTIPLDKRRMWFSKKKALNVLTHRQLAYLKALKESVRQSSAEYAFKLFKHEEEAEYKNKVVLLKALDENGETAWIKAEVTGLKLNDRKDGYALDFQYKKGIFKNMYLLEKENITWKFDVAQSLFKVGDVVYANAHYGNIPLTIIKVDYLEDYKDEPGYAYEYTFLLEDGKKDTLFEHWLSKEID